MRFSAAMDLAASKTELFCCFSEIPSQHLIFAQLLFILLRSQLCKTLAWGVALLQGLDARLCAQAGEG